jgi:hypothetical protein
MNIIAPVWKLRGLCPVCEQGDCLAFVSCTRCGHLLIVCEEEGSVFGDPRALEPHHGLSPSCPACGQSGAEDFPPASDLIIQENGFTVADYK